MASSRKTRRRGKTHVFPYTAIQPIIKVDSSGHVSVTPLEGVQGDVLPPLTDTTEINELLQEIRNFPIRKFEQQVGDIQDAIRAQTKEFSERIGNLRLDGNYDSLLEQHRRLLNDHRQTLGRLEELSSLHEGNAQVEQGYRVLVEEMRSSLRQLERLSELTETITRLQIVSKEFSDSVAKFTSEERNWEKLDVVLARQVQMMGLINDLKVVGMNTEKLTMGIDDAIQVLKGSVNVRLDTLEEIQREVQREISRYAESQTILEEIQREVSAVHLTQQPEILSRLENLSREVGSIPRIHQDELLTRMREILMNFASAPTSVPEDLSARLEGIRLAIEVQKMDLEQIDQYIRNGSKDRTEEILEKIKVLDVNSRLTVIEDGLRILSGRPEVDQAKILKTIEDMRPEINFQPLLDRMDALEQSLNLRDELRRGFENIEKSIGREGEEIRRIQTGMEGMRKQTEDALQKQLEVLSRMEMKLSNAGEGSKILEYQMKLAKCEEERSAFEKKIGSLTMEIDRLRSRMSEVDGAGEMERQNLETRMGELTLELENLRRKLTITERELETALRDKSVIDPRVDQLQRELDELRESKGRDEPKVRDLEQEIATLRVRLEACSDLEVEKRRVDAEVSDMVSRLSQVRAELEIKSREVENARMEAGEFKRRMDVLTAQLEEYGGKISEYEYEHATFMSLVGKIDEEIIRNNVVSDKNTAPERLADLIQHFETKLAERPPSKEENVVITDIPRYSVYPLLDEIMRNLLDGRDENLARDLFLKSKPSADQKLFNYYQQIFRTKGMIQTVVRESSFLHRLRNLIFADPALLKEVSDYVPSTPPLVAEEVEDLGKRPLDLSQTKVGKYVLTNALSPILPVTSEQNRMDEIAPKIASAIYRVFYLKEVLDVICTLGNQPRNIALENEIKDELAGIGSWNETRSQILLDMDDLYRVLIRVLSNIRGFISRIPTMNLSYAYGLEMRYVLLDALMKGFEDSKIRLESVAAVYEAREALPEPKLRNLLSYVKIRGDDGDIDPRFVFKVDDSERKILLGHQPFVFSSVFASDFGTYGSYQYDMVGPMTRVFTPRDTNQDVGNHLEEMVEELNRGRDICALALGPSGAGKTSTLLYFRGSRDMNISPQNGAIPVMLSRLSKEFVRAEVKAVEMTSSYAPDAGAGNYWREYEVFEGSVSFNRIGSEWISQTEIQIDVMDYGALHGSSGVCEISKPFEDMKRVRREFGNTSLAGFLAKLIDIRLNCGTTNNPDSSRTHLFVFIQLRNSDGSKAPYLIISDLAGREKAFDCASEAVLETLSMNRWYPELNNLIQNPIEGGLRKSSKKEIPTKEQLRDKVVERSFKATVDAFSTVNGTNLNEAVNDGYIKVFFGKPLQWYYGPLTLSGKDRLNLDLYRHVQTVSRFIVRDDYFFKKISQRFDNMDSQPELLKTIFEKIGSQEKLKMYDGILRYYSTMNYEDDKITAKSPEDRVRLQVKTLTGMDNAQNEHGGVNDYLNAVIIVNAIDQVLYGRPKEVCGIRNIEGVFINRSLDEYSRLVMTAASIDTNYGPLVHPECMPVVCQFAGLDCLLPKNIPKTIPQSAVSRVLSKGMGSSSFRPGTLFSIFLVINASRTQPEKRVQPLYDSLEVFMKKIYELCRGIEEKAFYAYRQDQNLLPIIKNIQMKLAGEPESLLSLYKDEQEVLSEYKSRVEYRGTDESRTLRTEDVQRLYQRSKDNWEGIRSRSNEIIRILSDERFPSMDSQTRSRFAEIMSGVLKIQLDVNRKNQDTIPGALAFVDELMKRGMQPMICSVDREEEVLPPTLISSWKNALYSAE